MRDAREPQREDEAALGFPAAAAWPVEPIQAWCNSHKQFGVAVLIADRVSGQECHVDAYGPPWAGTSQIVAIERLAKPPFQDGRINFTAPRHLFALPSPQCRPSKHRRERESRFG
jgi:hypothetical protein